MADIKCKSISFHNISKRNDSWEAGDYLQIQRFYIRDHKPTGFQNLPVKVLTKIFQYLDEVDIRKRVIPVFEHLGIIHINLNLTNITLGLP